ncbi:MAG: hypothetical protein HDT39_12850 [Lachnospiraceae bacterium]|nr:hypothetical protein [Lachnospiraceae bacterium]
MEEILNAIIGSVDKQCEQLLTEPDDMVFEVKINYFDDGEFIDLGVSIVVCDKNTENFREEYLSFIVHDEKLKLMILGYLETFGAHKRYSQLKKLARGIKKVLKEEGKYITKKTYFEEEEYD